ncbi:MAG: S41 family peptidase [Lachnospirales bacterium]
MDYFDYLYPDVINCKYDVRVNILKMQGISTFKLDDGGFYVLYSVYEDLFVGDIIISLSSDINHNSSIIRWHSSGVLKRKEIFQLEPVENRNFSGKNLLFSSIVDFKEFSLNQITERNFEKIFIDLRMNTGGNINHMLKIVSLFIPDDTCIQVLNLDSLNIEHMKVVSNKKIFYKELIIIRDRITYSSPEIFCKFFEKQKNVKIIGEYFGKNCIYRRNGNVYIKSHLVL